jgi:hypothetical protein
LALEGSPVTVTDQNGAIIGASTLDAGWFDEQQGCIFPFRVTGLPDATFYSVEVGQRGSLTYSQSELEATGWEVWATPGG